MMRLSLVVRGVSCGPFSDGGTVFFRLPAPQRSPAKIGSVSARCVPFLGVILPFTNLAARIWAAIFWWVR